LTNLQTTLHENRDEKLVSLIRQGNSVAFGHLVERHHPYVARIVSRFLFREEDSREVVQDTFIRIWKHLDDYDGRCLFTTWIYAIAFNLCLDKTKALKRRREVRLPLNYESQADVRLQFMDQNAYSDQAALGDVIRSLARQLSKVQRLVFVLRDLQDLPVEEVCQITGFDTDKVKSNLYYARKFMREKLDKGGYV
jgi:RNA polymerase sigma-70 factor (ECF subfamily)